ncbi:MAG: virulence RhuM family protein, partial [Candidatus Omnitrophica bacterium]|nr:virulence RhuM family protein [Candidatus Omnitrophota bacterium]
MKNKDFNNDIIIYEGNNGVPSIEVRLDGETVWLTQAQLVELYQSSKANISEHVKNIFVEGELSREATVRKFRTVQTEGSRDVARDIEHYNLDLIISLGYRVKSATATQFRVWATARLREYIVKGFTMDDERLKNLGGGGYWKELLDRIR